MMRRIALIVLLSAAGGAFLTSASGEAEKGEPAPRKGFVVHEWGVWRVHNDIELANADLRQIWDGLPKFVYGQVTTRDLPRHWQNIEPMDRPIIFFHSPDAFEADLRIDFGAGIPGVWWPGTVNPGIHNESRLGEPPSGPYKSLTWHLHVKKPLFNLRNRQMPTYKDVPEGHWVRTLRGVEADDIYATVGERNFGLEMERFVYYDGLLPRGKLATSTVEKDRVVVGNQAKHPLFDVTVVDRRSPDKPRLARLPQLDGGASKELDLKDLGGAKWPADGVKTLVGQLKDAGLFEDEAASLATLWTRDLLEGDGVTLFYRLPQEEYERLLPMTLKPAPEKLVRVGLVQHPYCEPGLAERVAKLVKELNDDDFEKREAAQKSLDAMGRAAFVHLLKLRETTFAPEAKRRIEELLEKHDARRVLKP
jgi:hypothetical protein